MLRLIDIIDKIKKQKYYIKIITFNILMCWFMTTK